MLHGAYPMVIALPYSSYIIALLEDEDLQAQPSHLSGCLQARDARTDHQSPAKRAACWHEAGSILAHKEPVERPVRPPVHRILDSFVQMGLIRNSLAI